MPDTMYKTTIVIWTDFNPVCLEIDDLVREACVGDAFCSKREDAPVKDYKNDPDWQDTDFFGDDTRFE